MANPQYITIPLTKGYSCIIDDVDSDLSCLRWHVQTSKHTDNVYATRIVYENNKAITLAMHRVILSRVLGYELKRSNLVDHIDGNGLNNLRSNLRLATSSQNCINKTMTKRKPSGFYRGVYAYNGKFRAKITVNNVQINLGYNHKTPEEAAQAYNEAAIKYHGEFARLNIIPKKD